MNRIRIAGCLVCLAVLASLSVGAAAQEISVEPTTVVADPSLIAPWWQALWKDVQGPIIAFAIPIIIFFIRKFLGERAAQIAQAMLQGAAERAAGIGVAAFPDTLTRPGPITKASPAVAAGVDYLRETMAEKIAYLGGSKVPLAEIMVAQLGRLKALSPVARHSAPGAG